MMRVKAKGGEELGTGSRFCKNCTCLVQKLLWVQPACAFALHVRLPSLLLLLLTPPLFFPCSQDVFDIFHAYKDHPVVARNSAPHSGAVAWVRGMVERIDEPMQKLRTMSKVGADVQASALDLL